MRSINGASDIIFTPNILKQTRGTGEQPLRVPQRRRVSDWGLGGSVASLWGMPRLALDLPDGLGRVENSRENGESRTEESAVRTRTAAATETGTDGPTVIRWHRCWAGSDDQ
jgi:hypothetical protein